MMAAHYFDLSQDKLVNVTEILHRAEDCAFETGHVEGAGMKMPPLCPQHQSINVFYNTTSVWLAIQQKHKCKLFLYTYPYTSG